MLKTPIRCRASKTPLTKTGTKAVGKSSAPAGRFIDFDKSNIRPDAASRLSSVARYMKVNPNVKLILGGHCDSRGSDEYNINHLSSHYLSRDLKNKFIRVMERIAAAFPPVKTEEINMPERFKADIASLIGHPVYYDQS